MKVLLVEDEAELVSAMRAVLERNGVILDSVPTIAEAEEATTSFAHDVIILDRRLPDGDGLSLISRLRAGGNTTPILVLTARGELADRLEGLGGGADDYLAKPFAIEEVLARIRALARRPAALSQEVVTVGGLTYDYVGRDAVVRGEPLDLTRREQLVLGALLRRVGHMVSRAVLMEAVFGIDDEVLPNALDTQVSRLRRKLIAADCGLEINGVRGVGFSLRATS